MNKAINIQDQYLNQLRKDGTVVTVFLMNGFQLRGQVKGFDNFTVLIETDGKQQLVFKHAISTFQPQKKCSNQFRGKLKQNVRQLAGHFKYVYCYPLLKHKLIQIIISRESAKTDNFPRHFGWC